MHETGNYFRFDKGIVRLGNWQAIEKAAKAVYPVIASHCSKQGYCYPHIETIAKLSGRTKGTVIRGIADLKRFSLVKVRKRPIKRGFRQNYYHVPSIADENDRWFPFHKRLISPRIGERGIWSRLSSSEQALYIVMRTFAKFDKFFAELYCEIIGSINHAELSIENFDEWFPFREWDWCQESTYKLADYAGISWQRIPRTLAGLRNHGLAERDDFGWMVFFRGKLPHL